MFTPRRTPLTELIVRLLPYTNPDASQSEQIERLMTAMHADGYALTTELRNVSPVHLLLVVDQMEELFSQTSSEKERQAFLGNMLHATSLASGKLSLLLVLRADFYAKLASYPDLANRVADRQVYVSPVLENLGLAITEPAKRSELSFEEGLIDEFLREMQVQAGALPLLQQALLELWKRREGQNLTLSAYRAIGGVKGAIASWAESVYESLSTVRQSLARRILVELVEPSETTENTRRRVLQRELNLDPDRAFETEDVLEHLVKNRILTTDRDAITQERSVEIAHESLIQEWPRLREWLAKSRASRLARSGVRERMKTWERHGKDHGSLLRGAELAEAEIWRQENPEDVRPEEGNYLELSRAAQIEEERLLHELWTLKDSTLHTLDRRGEAVQNIQSVASAVRRTSEDAAPIREAAPIPDLQIFIRLSSEAGRIRLNFALRAKDLALDLDFKEFGPIYIEMESRRFAHEFFRNVDDPHLEDEIAQMRLVSAGTGLFRSLPEGLQSTLWDLQGKVRDIQILSDEPYIPWEVMKLGRRKLIGWAQGPFLSEAFTVTRWFQAIPQHPVSIRLRHLALLLSEHPHLSAAASEQDSLLTLFRSSRTVTTIKPTLAKVVNALKNGDFDGWHFIGPGTPRTGGDANNSPFFLSDGELTPADLSWTGESFARNHPLVFLNSSGSGQLGFRWQGRVGGRFNA